MTKKEQALGLMALAEDEARTPAERQAAWDELGELKKSAKAAWEKLGVDPIAYEALGRSIAKQNAEAILAGHDPLDEEPVAEKPKPKPDSKGRGLITAEVKRLLRETDLGYAEIVEAVKALHPEAKTSTRSVASVASDMRKAQEKVAIRRPAAQS